jgi:nucleoside-diphosphate-sugar epimerase
MKLLITGGTGVLARAAMPLLQAAGHEIDARGRGELDVFDPVAVKTAVDGADAVMHLATHIPPREAQGDPEAWRVNDRLRSEATPILVDAALEAGTERFVFPSITFVYPTTGPADESTPVATGVPETARSALAAERAVIRFAEAGRQGVVLRLGLLYGPGTGSDVPAERFAGYGSTLRIEDAGSALAASLSIPSGIYNVASDGERISNRRLKEASGWRPEHSTPAPEHGGEAGQQETKGADR